MASETHMTIWPDRRILDLFGIDLPIIQAPMAIAQITNITSRNPI